MSYIIFSSLAFIAGIIIFISAFIRIKYLSKLYDYFNKGRGENPEALKSKLHRWSNKFAASVALIICAVALPLNLAIYLPEELEAIEYGVSFDELKQLKSEHNKLADSDFIDFVESYLKFGQSNTISHAAALKYKFAVASFVEARKLNIANYDDLFKHREAVEQREREKKIALEAEKKRIAEAEKKRIAEAERQSTSTTSSEPSIGTVMSVDTSTGNVAITGYTRVNVGKSTSVTVNGSRVKDEGDLRAGDRCLVRDARAMHASNLICTR